MWIVLQRSNWDVDAAVAGLASELGQDPELTRVQLDEWLQELHRSGMIVKDNEK